MLKNKKLLYILPEMAFTATVSETPKPDYYFVETFHQINGEFMKDENFVHESLKKLFERVEEGVYTLVLPDFLFTDTIVNVPETDDVKIAEYLRDQLLPRIEVSIFSHETRTSVLLQRKTTSKVQLSAFEKELAAALKLAIGAREIVLDEIVPLSWTLKAAVSLEPSLTIAQLGERLYLAEHYIGINQTMSASIDDVDILGETVRTLKGSDPNLQTTYLFTSELVETKLKEMLSKILPVQQLTEPTDQEAKIPSYVKQVVEVSARTLSLSEFAVPRFTLTSEDLLSKPRAEVVVKEETAEEELTAEVPEKVEEAAPAEAVEEPAVEAEETEVTAAPVEEVTAKEEMTEVAEKEKVAEEVKPVSAMKVEAASLDPGVAKAETAAAVATTVAAAETAEETVAAAKAESLVKEGKKDKAEAVKSLSAEEVKPALSFMKPKQIGTSASIPAKAAVKAEVKDDTMQKTTTENKKVTEQKGDMSSFLKKLLLFLLIFVIVIALGIGVGVATLAMTGKDVLGTKKVATPEPTVLATPEPVASVEAEPEPEEELDPAEFKVLVVNATGVSGLAGKAKTSLEKEGFEGVQTGNAAGDYDDEGTFVLMKDKNAALIKLLEAATGRKMTYDEDYKVEDANGRYDAVIVLNEE
ncbi:LytR C-terminal domain-containing protein [bacterium]|nr:LytR C-terminal domain-containing protein [bacterium]